MCCGVCVCTWVGTYDFNLPHPENPNNNPTTNSLATHREEWKGRLKCAARCDDPAARARAIVHAVAHYNDPKAIAEASTGLGTAIVGLDCRAKDFVSYANRDAD